MSLSLSLWSSLINYLNNSLSLSDWLAEGQNQCFALLLYLYFAFPFCFVFLNCVVVLILSVGVVLVSVFTVLV